MPHLSWNEIRQRAIQFSREWEGVKREKAEAQTFWNEFFNVFGIKRRTVAAFEEPVKTLKDSHGYIDLFWKGRLLAEHKSAGQPLDKAQSQAFNYIRELASANRNDEIPRYVIVSDFNTIILYDLEPEDQGELFKGQDYATIEIPLADLHKEVRHFAFIIGQQTHHFGEEDPANLEAAQIMADLHDTVEAGGYDGAELERLLVRILFCLFADDTGIFEPGQFQLYIENYTEEDGSDLGSHLRDVFEILDTPDDQRNKYLDEDLAAFPYVNGELFAGRLPLAGFNRDMRNRLIAACRFDWSRISPAIFGSLFQGIMDAKERRQIGGHYTSERDILKVIKPLFLDDLWAEFEQIKKDTRAGHRKSRLAELRNKLSEMQFLDPACGCGNFLVIAYRELRRLELELLKEIYQLANTEQQFTGGELASLCRVDVDQFYGIEIGEWPARIAETALWLTDHQMNTELSLAFGNLFQRIPLRAAPHIKCANALRMDWNDLLPAEKCSYVLGNPPFVGKKARNREQQEDMSLVYEDAKSIGVLDYVTCWYVKAGEYLSRKPIPCAFVSTNSITQGEQPGVLWPILWKKFGYKIHFAHRTFPWESEAKGAAHVHVVVIGFSNLDIEDKVIFDYEEDKTAPLILSVQNINPYLIEANDVVLSSRNSPINEVAPVSFGNMPNDGGYLIFTDEEKCDFLENNEEAKEFIRPLISAKEYFNGVDRWCLWLKDVPPRLYRHIAPIKTRVEAVRKYRLDSKRAATNRLAEVPYLFGEIRQPESNYVLIPRHSSERRPYIPFSYFDSHKIVHDSCLFVPNATPFHFGVLTSAIHMAWVRHVCGRIKSDYRYSAKLVYNNFPWPMDATDAQRAKVEECAEAVLAVRQKLLDGGSTLADLYDPLYMPADLLKAHQALDRAVDRCYRKKKFDSDRERVEHLFQLYEHLTAPLAPTEKTKKRRRKAAK